MKVEKCYYCYVNAILSLETSMGRPSNSMFAHLEAVADSQLSF